MGVNLQKIKKWTNMILGRSVYHVNQDEGKLYSKTEVKGYYNNLTEKITRFGEKGVLVPSTIVDTGEEIYFPIAIFQYGLAAYDLYLRDASEEMKAIVIACADWAVDNQDEKGRWVTFAYENAEMPYSAMAQGEAISLLIRANHLTKSQKYTDPTHRAYKYMITPIEKDGPTKYVDNKVYFYECPADPLILNGWIFSLWGLWDYVIEYNNSEAKVILQKTINTLENELNRFDLKYWSKYEDGIRIASPFYHSLHIAQLKVMFVLTGKPVFKYYADKWEQYQKNWFNRKRAFIVKAMQKIFQE